MDSTLITGLLGALSTLTAGLLPLYLRRKRRGKSTLYGTLDQLLTPLEKSNAHKIFKEMIPIAHKISICGWSLVRTIDDNRHGLREFVQKGGNLRILILDPETDSVRALDSVLSHSEPSIRESLGWPKEYLLKDAAKSHLNYMIGILHGNNIINLDGQISDRVHLCKTLLPYGLIMVECENGKSWLSVQVYPLHPDTRIGRRLTFYLTNNSTELWHILESQFEDAWKDPNLSYPLVTADSC